jgi:hypothetical protein
MKWLLALTALVLSGCGVSVSGSSVDDDPLTAKLGRSSTLVQRASLALTDSALAAQTKKTGVSDVNRSNEVVEHLINYEPSKVDISDLDSLIENPDAPYRQAIRSQAKMLKHEQALANARIASSNYATSPEDIREFVGHWNAYIDGWHGVAKSMRAAFDQGLSFRSPTTAFLRQMRSAIRHRDADAYRLSVDRYKAKLKKAGEGLYDGTGPLAGALKWEAGPEQKAFDALLDDANSSDEVRSLVTALRRKYPNGLFAERFSR